MSNQLQIKDITPANVRNYVSGTFNYLFEKNLPQFYLEQIQYRAYLCRDCLKKGACKVCGCKTPQMFFAPKKHDSLNRWPQFFYDEIEWTKFKETSQDYQTYLEILREKSISVHDDSYFNDIATIPMDIRSILEKGSPTSSTGEGEISDGSKQVN